MSPKIVLPALTCEVLARLREVLTEKEREAQRLWRMHVRKQSKKKKKKEKR